MIWNEAEGDKMIIAGFSGVGKTTFANTHQNVIDLYVMPYKYTNLNEVNNNYNDEKEKVIKLFYGHIKY